ncbi:pentatricopeptide repeat-containing protein [Striga asiatica]|uniref:Pentatricopeptide repeat-containing protein n=1 Tax=Striga asiatica TaxID=4170 RepID=A0A5A7NXZ3_STRAF|nr:pentatricopeptide repeat-containing protein [Striga asiatica]
MQRKIFFARGKANAGVYHIIVITNLLGYLQQAPVSYSYTEIQLVRANLLTSSNMALSLRQSITRRLYSNSCLAYADFSGTLKSDDRPKDPPTHNLHDSSLINMLELNSQLKHLTKSGDLKTARNMFDTLPKRDEITWTTLIAGYISSSDTSEAISLF